VAELYSSTSESNSRLHANELSTLPPVCARTTTVNVSDGKRGEAAIVALIPTAVSVPSTGERASATLPRLAVATVVEPYLAIRLTIALPAACVENQLLGTV